MKKLLLILILIGGLTACDKNEASIKPTTPSTSLVMTQGKWKITNLNHNGYNESGFTDYQFQFNLNGTLNAVKEGVTTSGYWSTRTENNEQKLNISFSSPPLNELNFDWRVKQINVNMMNLGDGGTEYLDFQKL
jgi:hypothetical protein